MAPTGIKGSRRPNRKMVGNFMRLTETRRLGLDVAESMVSIVFTFSEFVRNDRQSNWVYAVVAAVPRDSEKRRASAWEMLEVHVCGMASSIILPLR